MQGNNAGVPNSRNAAQVLASQIGAGVRGGSKPSDLYKKPDDAKNLLSGSNKQDRTASNPFGLNFNSFFG